MTTATATYRLFSNVLTLSCASWASPSKLPDQTADGATQHAPAAREHGRAPLQAPSGPFR